MAQELIDRIHDMMSEYKGTPKHLKYYHQHRGYDEIAAKLEAEGFDSKEVDDAIDEHGNQWWLKR